MLSIAARQVVLAIKVIALLVLPFSALAQQYELNNNWKCARANTVAKKGEEISQRTFLIDKWLPAVVPGTVLTTLLRNGQVPDPFYGMNNKLIPDIYNIGRDHYTYWFVRDFEEPYPVPGDKIWLMFRGINYSAVVYVNGRRMSDVPDKGMYLRQSYDITPCLAKDGHNRIAVIVYPPDPAGNPNGGQGGDGTIAHSITNQYTAGWDWIQPVRDRNTGIWDKVCIRRTKQVHVENTHVVTLVPGRRKPVAQQASATVKITTEVENPGETAIDGVVQYEVEGKKSSIKLKVEPGTSEFVEFPPLTLENPRLWWPNGYGQQALYTVRVRFLINGKQQSDEETVTFGVREIKGVWNKHTNSREIRVNGQKIFIKGGNWIASDAMLRCTAERYDAEVRYHRDMNLNLIRVWGGGITERPEFYDACDKYGLLVFQDLWVSGDCNGRWYDPLKHDDTTARRRYPDDHSLFLESAADQVMMLRNHPSLAIWCGGNEIRPPADILAPLRDSLLPKLDDTRIFFEYSNDDSMSLRSGDGPYTVQPDTFFWQHRSFPFNSEIGSVGIGDLESLERFIPGKDLVPPHYDTIVKKWIADTVWQYHKYSSYDSMIELYGHPKDIKDFLSRAQLVNYNQYRALAESFMAHMWDWYTGFIIWKTQNPWTAMVGQMYDVYLDPNACFYGTQEADKPLHIMFDPARRAVLVSDTRPHAGGELAARIIVFDMNGHERFKEEHSLRSEANKVQQVHTFGRSLDSLCRMSGAFLVLQLRDGETGALADENIYWLPDAKGKYSGLPAMPEAEIRASAKQKGGSKVEVTIENPAGGPLAFFMRASVIDSNTYDRILPAFCENNYITVLPGQHKTITIEHAAKSDMWPMVDIEGWNIEEQFIEIKQ